MLYFDMLDNYSNISTESNINTSADDYRAIIDEAYFGKTEEILAIEKKLEKLELIT